MWWLHEVHELRGPAEDEFEARLRDEWWAGLADVPGAHLLYAMKHAHGTGPSYRFVTITALEDPAAYGRLAAAVHGGALADASYRLDALRHDVTAKLLTPLPWSRLQRVSDLGPLPDAPVEHRTSVFMEDTVWPYEGRLEDYVDASGAHYAKEMTQDDEAHRILEVLGAFRTLHGAGRRREIVLWQKVTEPKALVPLVLREVPPEYRQPGTWMHDALDVRDQWESRLLRAVSWSPLH